VSDRFPLFPQHLIFPSHTNTNFTIVLNPDTLYNDYEWFPLSEQLLLERSLPGVCARVLTLSLAIVGVNSVVHASEAA
jgi:hypothetical protein